MKCDSSEHVAQFMFRSNLKIEFMHARCTHTPHAKARGRDVNGASTSAAKALLADADVNLESTSVATPVAAAE
jgi:hypothetical protein